MTGQSCILQLDNVSEKDKREVCMWTSVPDEKAKRRDSMFLRT